MMKEKKFHELGFKLFFFLVIGAGDPDCRVVCLRHQHVHGAGVREGGSASRSGEQPQQLSPDLVDTVDCG